jgi:UDP-N-acetyl-alpha-D-quinovosamine dehydrogenase
MKVLVTGASGFVGRALAGALEARGIAWSAATRDTVGDIGPTTDWRAALEGCDRVVHLANLAHASGIAQDALRAVNVGGTRRLAEQAAAAGVARFVYLSSVKAAHPDDAYGAAKQAAERALAGIRDLAWVALRPPLVYGPGVKANFLALLRAVDQGWPLPLASVRNRRSLVYVGNLADAILRCLEASQAVGRTYAVADGAPVSTPELIRALAQALGRSPRLFAFPPALLELAGSLAGRGDTVRRLTRSLEVDDHAIRRELDWRPPFTFEEGIRLTAQWHLASRKSSASRYG